MDHSTKYFIIIISLFGILTGVVQANDLIFEAREQLSEVDFSSRTLLQFGPYPKIKLSIKEIEDGYFFKWTAPIEPINHYAIEFRDIQRQSEDWYTLTRQIVDSTSFIVRKLNLRGKHLFRIKALEEEFYNFIYSNTVEFEVKEKNKCPSYRVTAQENETRTLSVKKLPIGYNISWDPIEVDVLYYIVEYKKNKEEWRVHTEEDFGTRTNYVLEGTKFIYGEEFSFRLFAESENTTILFEEENDDKILNVMETDDGYYINWLPPPPEDIPEEMYFDIGYKESSGPWKIINDDHITSTYYKVNFTKRDTTHSFRIYLGGVAYSETATFNETSENDDEEPSDLTSPIKVGITPYINSYLITWNPPECATKPKSYDVEYNSKEKWRRLNQYPIVYGTSYLAKKIRPQKVYSFRVIANSMSSSATSDVAELRATLKPSEKRITYAVIGGSFGLLGMIVVALIGMNVYREVTASGKDEDEVKSDE